MDKSQYQSIVEAFRSEQMGFDDFYNKLKKDYGLRDYYTKFVEEESNGEIKIKFED